VAVAYPDAVYASYDAGHSWAAVGPVNSWASLAATPDLGTLVGGTYSGVFVSRDRGATWAAVPGMGARAMGVAVDASGAHIYAAGYNGGGYVLSSADGGLTSVAHAVGGTVGTAGAQPGAAIWIDIACSGDGSRVLAIAYQSTANFALLSTDYGETWAQVGNGVWDGGCGFKRVAFPPTAARRTWASAEAPAAAACTGRATAG
jgi:hypothetical protein